MSARSSSRTTGTLLAAAVALFAIGCGDDPLAPSLVAGTYVLQSVNGVALPAPTAYPTPPGDQATVIADTLRLTADGRGTIVTVQDYVMGDGDPSRQVGRSEFSFTTTEDGIEITFDCPPDVLALCAPGPHMVARYGNGRLVATNPLADFEVELVYSEVQPLD